MAQSWEIFKVLMKSYGTSCIQNTAEAALNFLIERITTQQQNYPSKRIQQVEVRCLSFS